MKAFHGDAKRKAHYMERLHDHATAKTFIRGAYWLPTVMQGCAVGATLHGHDHARYEIELGIPTLLAYCEDGLFEQMYKEDAMQWPVAFLDAVPVGADLSHVFEQFAEWLMGPMLFAAQPYADVTRYLLSVRRALRVPEPHGHWSRLASQGALLRRALSEEIPEGLARVGQSVARAMAGEPMEAVSGLAAYCVLADSIMPPPRVAAGCALKLLALLREAPQVQAVRLP